MDWVPFARWVSMKNTPEFALLTAPFESIPFSTSSHQSHGMGMGRRGGLIRSRALCLSHATESLRMITIFGVWRFIMNRARRSIGRTRSLRKLHASRPVRIGSVKYGAHLTLKKDL